MERFLMNFGICCGRRRGNSKAKVRPRLADVCLSGGGAAEASAAGDGGSVELAGRSPEHVARATRKWFGKTPTELINQTRMTFAARRLAKSNDGITEIAEECGLTNLSHFYNCSAMSTRYAEGISVAAAGDPAAGDGEGIVTVPASFRMRFL